MPLCLQPFQLAPSCFWHPSASVVLVMVASQPWGALARMFLELVGELIGFYLAKVSQDTMALKKHPELSMI